MDDARSTARPTAGELPMSEWQPSTCMRCAVGCGFHQRGGEGGIAEARGDPDHPTNNGADCKRGITETVDPGGERLTQPLIRRGGELQPTDWDTALGIVATRFIEALSNGGGNVAVFGSGQQTTEAAYALGKLARGGFGTRYYDANTRLCMASAVTAYDRAFGSDAPPPTYDDIPDAETHLVWGANPATAHPVLYQWLAESADDEGSQLVVVDPVETATAADADSHIQPAPGTDLALLRGVLAEVIDSGAVDTAFVENHTTGFEELAESLPDVEAAADTAGIPVEAIETIAEATTAKTLAYWGMGVNQSTQGTATARALIDLCLATGNLGPGSGPFSLTGQANSMGTRVCGSTSTWPGHREFADSDARKEIADAWDVPLSRLPETTGPGIVGTVDALAHGDVDVCWTVATNPAAGMPDSGHVKAALDDAFLVVQDAYRSETVAHADVVFPAATWGETEGTVVNMDRRVSRVTAVSEPPGAARQDLDIIAAIGDRIAPELFDDPPLSPGRVFDELTALTAETTADLSGLSYERLADELAVRWPAPNAESAGGYRYYEDGEWSFPTDSNRAAFSATAHGSLPEPTDNDYPLTLTTGRTADHYNTGTRTADRADEIPTARINANTVGDHLAAFDRGKTVIGSRRGEITVAVEVDNSIPPGMVWLPVHQSIGNELTLAAVDPESAQPNFKQCAVALTAPRRPQSAGENRPATPVDTD
jgi:assimilatory nitrate reductase catalytic subunit